MCIFSEFTTSWLELCGVRVWNTEHICWVQHNSCSNEFLFPIMVLFSVLYTSTAFLENLQKEISIYSQVPVVVEDSWIVFRNAYRLTQGLERNVNFAATLIVHWMLYISPNLGQFRMSSLLKKRYHNQTNQYKLNVSLRVSDLLLDRVNVSPSLQKTYPPILARKPRSLHSPGSHHFVFWSYTPRNDRHLFSCQSVFSGGAFPTRSSTVWPTLRPIPSPGTLPPSRQFLKECPLYLSRTSSCDKSECPRYLACGLLLPVTSRCIQTASPCRRRFRMARESWTREIPWIVLSRAAPARGYVHWST